MPLNMNGHLEWHVSVEIHQHNLRVSCQKGPICRVGAFWQDTIELNEAEKIVRINKIYQTRVISICLFMLSMCDINKHKLMA